MHLVLFDIDGTLMRGVGIGTRALKLAFAETFSVPTDGNEALDRVFVAGSTDPVIMREMSAALGIEPERYAAELPRLREVYFRHLRRRMEESETKHACAGVPDLLERMKAHPDLLLGLLTGNLEPAARIKLEPFGLNPYFTFGGFGGDGADRAAQAEHAVARAAAIAGSGFAPGDVLIVGDTVNDVRAARAHDHHVAGVGTGWHPLERLREEGASAVFATLEPEHGFPAWLDGLWNLGW